MKVTEFLPHFNNVQWVKPEQWEACCSAHDDRHPSVVITEVEDRLLIHCRAGCRTSDVLAAVGLGYPDLFLDSGKPKGTTWRNGPRQPERVPHWHWNWRSQCAELERAIQEKREHAEAMIAVTQGLDVNALTTTEFVEVMDWVSRAYGWLKRCDQLDETLYRLQQVLRAEERTMHQRNKKRKTVMV